MSLARLLLITFLLQHSAIIFADSSEVLGYELGVDTTDSFMEKSRAEGSGPIQLIRPGSNKGKMIGEIFTIYEPEVDVEFPGGMNSNTRIKSVYARFMNSGPLYSIKVTVKGGNELLGIRKQLMEKYPVIKNPNKWQIGMMKNAKPMITSHNCNYWGELEKISVCFTSASPETFGADYTEACLTPDGDCPRTLYITYNHSPLLKKAVAEAKAKKDELGKVNNRINIENANGL